MLGPNLVALITGCSGLFRHSKRVTQEFLALVLNLDLSLGSVANAEQEMSCALEAPVNEIVEHVQAQAIVNMDETGHREGRQDGHSRRAWLWIAATTSVALFKIATSRGADVAKAILGVDFKGILGSDRWGGYRWIDAARRQLCWAHLIRDFQGWVDGNGAGARLGAAILVEVKKMFEWWHRVRDETLTRADFQRLMSPVEARILSLLDEALVCPTPKVAGMAKQILGLKAALFTFVHSAGVEPTNNLCERLLRHAVMRRKTSYGTQSANGSRFVERILTAVTTLRLQGRNVLEYLASAYRAHLTGAKPPSLLPSGS